MVLSPSIGVPVTRVIVYYTGGGESAEVIADPRNEKRGILSELAARGYVVASVSSRPDHWGSPVVLDANDALFGWIRGDLRVSKVGILCQSMGGLSAYSWACRHPEKVCGIYGIYPVTNLGSMLAGALRERISDVYAQQGIDINERSAEFDPIREIESSCLARVPAMHRHGKEDALVQYGPNAVEFSRAYRRSGGRLKLLSVEGLGHEAHPTFFNPAEAAAFMDSLHWE